jgi:Domain of unknown function (DUF4148)
VNKALPRTGGEERLAIDSIALDDAAKPTRVGCQRWKGSIMFMLRKSLVAATMLGSIIAATLLTFSPAAFADGPTARGLTRAQVQAELAEAIRNGDIVFNGETGMKLNELYPHRYPARTAVAGKTPRAQVQAELAEAIRNGDIVVNGETGMKLNELYPHRYPARAAVAGKTRAQVQAELAEAIRNGDIAFGESSLTMRERFPHLYPKRGARNVADTPVEARDLRAASPGR